MKNGVEERALVILVPEVETFVSSLRTRYGDLDGDNVPAHITINIPFRPAAENESQLEEILERLFSGMTTFQFALTEVRRFPTALYLAPEPEERFRALIDAVAARFPESPPYEGQYEDVIPHLTVIYLEDGQEIDTTAEALAADAVELLPIVGEVAGVMLLEKIGGEWKKRRLFQLAS